MENVSEDVYRNLEGITAVQKRSSAKFESPIDDMSTAPDRVRLRQSLANFGEGMKIFGSTLAKLNQFRVSFEKRLTTIEQVTSSWATRKELDDTLSALNANLKLQIDRNAKNAESSAKLLHEEVEKVSRKFDEGFGALESQALHQIKDCQELLKTRISAAYLDSRLNHLNDLRQSTVCASKKLGYRV